MFKKWPKTPRLTSDTFTITEKIDGTNACVVVLEDGEVLAQSRTRIITPEDDNFGFAAWVDDNKYELLKLGPGHHYGEWWGQGIQRNYGLKERRLSLFSQYYKNVPDCCNVVPILYHTPVGIEHLMELVHLCVYEFEKVGSQAAPGFMDVEGLIIQSATYPNLRYKHIINK